MSLVRRARGLFADAGGDVVLAVLAVGLTQVWFLGSTDDWIYARLGFPLFVAAVPVLVALCRIEPMVAVVGLALGAFGSLLIGNVNWVVVAGCCLALWWLPARCDRRTVLVTVAAVTALPFGLNLIRVDLATMALPSVYEGIYDENGVLTGEMSGIAQDRAERIYDLSWPWWYSVLFLLVGVASWLWWSRHSDRIEVKAEWQRRQELGAFLRRPDRILVLDALLATVMSSFVLLDLVRDVVKDGNWWTAPGWMPYAVACSALTLVVRRRWPVVPVVVLAVSALLTYWQTWNSWSVLGALGLAVYSLAAGRLKPRWILVTAVAVLGALPLIARVVRYPQMILIFPELDKQPFSFGVPEDGILHNTVYDALVDRKWPVSLSLLLLLPLSLGFLARLYWRNREASQREAALEQAAAEQDAAKVVLTERSHIARDLHDVVAHAVNLMVIQAETGPDLIARGDQDVLAGFQRIGDAGRRALGELDRMLSALRDAEGVPDPELTPQPGLSDLRRLVKDVAHDGLVVELDVQGETELAPTGHQLAAYRLVQEALTNVVRHAEASKVVVMLEVQADELRVEVSDNGHGFDPEVARTGGRHGLAGMRERVRIHHGTLTIDSTPARGTSVSARIPLTAEVSR
ncbi:sensor histidine kinase [Kribbella italica]|uniref:histidine kinase n=1 Tax=Kribbella italica TaxID=1540520 RepID=A0A7W9JBS8_9ACTN|nr:sensor histidine kinase [Kribbella italica]MBB5838887.1 signal transduction histidine kinase [Kribbella italica]